MRARRPRLWSPPAAMAMNVPLGTVVWPSKLLPQPASVPSLLMPRLWYAAGGDGGERAAGDVGLAVAVVAPTGQRAVALDAQAVEVARRDGGERAAGDSGLADVVVAPTGQRAVALDAQAVVDRRRRWR